MKYLQFAVHPDVRIQQAAIMALRNPGQKDPLRVSSVGFGFWFLDEGRMVNWLGFA